MSKYSKTNVVYDHGPLGWIFLMAYIGAAVYFVQQSSGFWGFVLGLLKAAVWPAYVLFHALTLLQA